MVSLSGLFWLCASLLLTLTDSRADTVCAQVKIEIKQELTLERQAFDAMMRISNGLDTLPITNVDIQVLFEDEQGNSILASSDPNNTNAKFYIRVDRMEGIANISGQGIVAQSSVAEIHWLIIPAPGAAEGSPSGKLYYVGASLSYTLGGERETLAVTPDFITVKPLPQLSLDYFLTQEVNADDPLTSAIEPIEPFTLGVRVRNNGLAEAKNLKIDSAQPKIVENEQGLLIGFEIQGSYVDDRPAEPTLLIDFGNISGGSSKVGRWLMTSTLSGEFVEFTASFSHADELGGALTSILEAADTHLLLHDVRVDLPGRDAVRDFLARDGDLLRVYESDSIDTEVLDRSSEAEFTRQNQNGSQLTYHLRFPATQGFASVKLTDPHAGQKSIVRVVRSDGKQIPGENTWISKSRNRNTNPMSWDYAINLFDANSTGDYTILMDDVSTGPVAPLMQFIPDRSTYEGQQIGFVVEASDANGDLPVLRAEPLPSGSVFTDNGNGTAFFNWTPAVGQAGRYTITFTASDGRLSSSRSAVILVNSGSDTDGDGMEDAWELEHFGSLDRDGHGDLDGDGISDLNEYLAGTDPNNGPVQPVIESPLYDAEVLILEPELTVRNSAQDVAGSLSYSFELYADSEMTELVAEVTGMTASHENTTSWVPDVSLQDNSTYTWRVRSSNGALFSEWVEGRFRVNTANDAPGALTVSYPVDGMEVDRVNPLLAVNNANDPDLDVLTYGFELSLYDDLSEPIVSVEGLESGVGGATGWVVESPLQEDTYYYWQARVTDEHGVTTFGPISGFFVNTQNQAPSAPTIFGPATGSTVTQSQVALKVSNAVDQDLDELTYYFDFDRVETFDSEALQSFGPIIETPRRRITWIPVRDLEEDVTYYWRVKASDGAADSEWVSASFTVNAENVPPAVPVIQNPGKWAWVPTLQPTLSVNQSLDPDGDEVSYRFELYADNQLEQLLYEHLTTDTSWHIETALVDNKRYYWRVRAEDGHEAVSAWAEISNFYVDDNGINDPPTFEFTWPVADLSNVRSLVTLKWVDSDPDNNAKISLFYDTDNSGADGVLITDVIREDPDGGKDLYYWQKEVEPGTYWIYAVIDDGTSSETVYCDYSITIAEGYPRVHINLPGMWQ
ncbi:MAG: Ig-like domain-containing protein [Candidatus Thiodiazotropha sp.]